MSEYWSKWHAMRRLSRRRFLQAGAAASGTGLIAACGSSSTNSKNKSSNAGSAATTAAGSATAAAASAAAAAKVPTGTLTVLQGVDANTLDPNFTNSTPEGNILRQVMDYMLYFNPKTFQPEPWLTELPKAINETTWEVKLKATNAKFHDGTPINADALKFTFDRFAPADFKWGGKPIVPSFGRLISYDHTDIVDATTVRVFTKAPAPILPTLLSYGIPVLPPSVYKDDSAANLAKVAATPVGSGPFKFVEWVKDDHLTMTVNPDYWGPKPAFEKAIWKAVPEVSTRILALQRGEADIIVNVPPDQADDLKKAGQQVSSVKGGRIIFVGMRCDHAPFTDKRVRQAVNYAMNFDAINKALLNGAATRAVSILNPPHEPPDAKAFAYDPAKAKQLLSDAGFPNGFSTTMDFPQ
ncbi:MAG: ABC transporter substrate-binding protein, partial [Dehalococcoidia bacterium]